MSDEGRTRSNVLQIRTQTIKMRSHFLCDMIGVNDWHAPNLSSPPLLPFMETQRNLLKLLSYEAFYDIYDKICICTILPVPVTQGKGWKVPAVRWWWICWCSIAQHLIDWYISRLNFFSLILMWPGPDMATKLIKISTYAIFSSQNSIARQCQYKQAGHDCI